MTDRTTYAPFILIDGTYRALFMSDGALLEKQEIFLERAAEGWEGNGYDWTALAKVLIVESLPQLGGAVSFGPESGMFSAQGSLDDLKLLATEMRAVYDDNERIRDLLSRAELD